MMEGLLPLESVHWPRLSGSEYMHTAIVQSSFKNPNLTDRERIFQLKNYYKFMMVRNPLERLVSAYRSKIEQPLIFLKFDRQPRPIVTNITKAMRYMGLEEAHKRLIFSKYRPGILRRWAKSNGSYNISVEFPTYVRWIMDSRDADLNEHFSSILHNAAPCRVDYHLYLNFKNYSRDVHLLISRLNTSTDYFVDRDYHTKPGSDTRSTLPHYYSQLSPDSRRRLFARMAPELDFYYHLYPEEQLSHIPLLGVNKQVYKDVCSAEIH